MRGCDATVDGYMSQPVFTLAPSQTLEGAHRMLARWQGLVSGLDFGRVAAERR